MVIFGNIKVFFSEKLSNKFKYLAKSLTFLIIKNKIYAFLAKYIAIVDKKVMCTIKTSTFLLNTALANFFLLIKSTFLVIDRTLVVV